MENKQRCTNCKCWRDLDAYIGKKNVPVKRCIKCREKDARQKKNPIVKEKRNERQKDKQYYKAYREKKRTENEESYLQHNAELQKNWRNNNTEHLALWKKKNITYRLDAIRRQAKVKGYQWDEEMTYDKCKEMMTSPCFYCDFKSEETVNGIDRMDNTKGYILTNCVGCCKNCNFIKKSLDAHTFIERCIHIASCHGFGDMKYPDIWPLRSNRALYSTYKRRAELKNIVFEITIKEFLNIIAKPCHYCARPVTPQSSNGIDRIDNMNGYTLDNVLPCCSECNIMRTLLPYNEFIDTCKNVAKKATILEIPAMPRCIHVITKRGKKKSEEL